MNGGQRNARGFTIRESLLIADYLRTFGANATESAKRAGYSGNRNTLGVIAFETLRRPKIAREIKRRMSRKLSTEQIESEIADVALSSVIVDAPAKMKALDLLAKINGMITQKVETADTTINTVALTFLSRRISKLSTKTGKDAKLVEFELQTELSDTTDEDYSPDLDASVHPEVWPSGCLIGQNAPEIEQITGIGDQ